VAVATTPLVEKSVVEVVSGAAKLGVSLYET
jgi:hypothetical protein